jgi:hypothetical protein
MLAMALLLIAVAAIAQAPSRDRSDTPAGAFQSLAPGVDYLHEVRKAGPLSIHVLRIDRIGHHWDLRTGLGQGTVFGLAPLDGIAARMTANLKRPALAAINGDFFVIKSGPYQGDPRGLQIADGELVSRPAGSSFWAVPGGELRIGPVLSKLRVAWPDGKTETALGLNEARADDAAVLYTPTLGIQRGKTPHKSPGTRTQGGRELVLEQIAGRLWLPIQAGSSYSARVRKVRSQGNTRLAPDCMVLSIGPKQIAALPPVRPGDVLHLILETEPDLRGVQTAIGAGRVLMQDGRQPDLGPANQPRHPRSLVGWNRQYLFFVVVDGRQPGLSVGMTYPETAALALHYGCTSAVELDGGGSSTLWATGKILNSPSDGKPRPVANALILFPRD